MQSDMSYKLIREIIMKRAVKTLGTLALAGCAAMMTIPSATAAEDSGLYFGGNIGQSRAKIDNARITRGLTGAGLTTTSIVDDKLGLGYKVFGGYQINRYFALEGGWFDLGRFGFTSTTVPAGTLNGRLKVWGANLDAVGMLPITEQFSAFGRFGVTYAQTRDNFTSTGAVAARANPNPKKRAWNYKFGAGLEYDFVPSFGMRIEAERYRISDAVGNRGDIDLYSAGLVYRFGKETMVAAAEPEPVVETPEPVAEPIPEPVAKKKVFTTDSSADDSLFGFNKSELRPKGKQALDSFVEELKGAKYEVIKVTGHTDRIGSDAYNQKLSERRAAAVRDYLIESAGIPADKIMAIGAGESDPVTKPGDCDGMDGNQLITCLAPDRRVEVEVSSTRTAE